MPKKLRWLLILIIGGALLLPMLGSFGLWDPVEIRQADLAQEVSKTGSYRDVTVDGRYSPRPPLYVWLVAVGFKLFGVNELAGRLPLALVGLLALLIAYRVGRRLISQEAGIGAALVLGSTPAFLFQARQLESDVVFYASILAGVGGLAAYLCPANGRRSRWDLAMGAAGLVAGFLSRGLVLGVAYPLAALFLTLGISWRTVLVPPEPPPPPEPKTDDDDPDSDPYREQAAEPPPEYTLGVAFKQALPGLGIALLIAAGLVGLFLAILKNPTYMLLGAEWRKSMAPPTFETTFRDLGWGFFPWFGLVPLALGSFVLAQRGRTSERPPDAFPKLLVLLLVVGGYILSSFWQGYMGSIRYPALPWLALGVGVLAADLWVTRRMVHRFWAVVAVGLVLVLQQDYLVRPDGLVFSHLPEAPTYPTELKLKNIMRVIGAIFAVLFFFSLGGVPTAVGEIKGDRWYHRLACRVAGWLDMGGGLIRRLFDPAGHRVRAATAVVAIIFAGFCTFYLTPQLSLHLSNKALFGTFHKCKSGGELLAQYQVPGRGAAYYNNGQVEDVNDQQKLFELLNKKKRIFILVPAHQLAPIDKAARMQDIPYYVLDDRSSQYLILSNKLEGKCKVDHNPLRKLVLKKEPKIKTKIHANFDNKVALLGYEVDDPVTRGGKFRLKLFFKVLGQMPSGYKIFIHFDQPANRFHGDHVPLGGKFPTEYWMPGDYIVDPHDIDIPIFTTPSGSYNMMMGFWLGSNRIKVIEGPNDGSDRVNMGTLRVR